MLTLRQQPWLVLSLFCGLAPLWVWAEERSPVSHEIQRRIREDATDVPANGLRFGFDAESKILAALRSKLVVSWDKKPLREVLASLQQVTSVPFEIDEEAWAEDGMNPNEEVSLELGDSTALFALQQLCSQLHLGWTVEYGTVQLMPESRADEHFNTRVYNISKLTKWLVQNGLDKLTEEELDDGASGSGGGGGGFFSQFGGGGETKPPPQTPATIRRRANRELLAERMIANFVVSNSSGRWEVQDGEGGTINYWSQRLIVRQSLRVHLEVAGCLRSLERLMLGEGNPATMTFPGLADPVEEQTALEAALRKRITLRADGIPLRTVIFDLAKQHGLRIRFARYQTIDEWMDAASPVTSNLTDVSLRLALQLLLEPASLEAFAHEGMLMIGGTTYGDELLLRTTAYRMDKIPHAANRPKLETLILEQTSGKWEHQDGEGGSLSWLGPKILLVHHVPRIQNEIADLLRKLQADVVEGKLVFESLGGPHVRDFELKLYKFDSADELKEFQEALPFVLRDLRQVTKTQKIGVQLAIEATPIGHEEVDKFLKQYRGDAKSLKEASPSAGAAARPIETKAGSMP
ncbi:MAG: hypothetical protein H7062_06470 [Candidatus Saccharimonas sp.]|nr:hypothetical protein [Planctomycetaceae bacterium]